MRPVFRLLLLAMLLAPGSAQAHALFGEGNDFYNGLAHPFLSLPHLLATLGMGLLAGLHGGPQVTRYIAAFLGALVAGLVSATYSLGFTAETPLLIGALLLGLALAIGRPLPMRILLPAFVILVLLMGLDFASETAGSKVGLNFGTGISLYFLFLVALGFAESFGKKDWQRIGFRIAGSWMAASALLALSFRIFIAKS
jgi:urease accessory protein